MSGDHYAAAGPGWAAGATLVYRPLAEALVSSSPVPLDGRTVLDVGAGTGVAGAALRACGAVPVAVDRSAGMLAAMAAPLPPRAVADVRALPLRPGAVDAAVAAFVLNHVTDPERALAEVVRVVRPGGAVLATVYANSFASPARNRVDEVAVEQGWRPPAWYLAIKEVAAPVLGTAASMAAAARAAGLVDVAAEERVVDVGVTEPDQLVTYRFGQAQFAPWIAALGDDAVAIRRRAAEAVAPVMEPYRPLVVFLAARVPQGV
ncbi:MAG TPA: methyltransferase domain-containing protein [Acidimicrobiales bacterium]|nr:methyltransferase domain-containing protein [Acidimicrobiales bacterium]